MSLDGKNEVWHKSRILLGKIGWWDYTEKYNALYFVEAL